MYAIGIDLDVYHFDENDKVFTRGVIPKSTKVDPKNVKTYKRKADDKSITLAVVVANGTPRLVSLKQLMEAI